MKRLFSFISIFALILCTSFTASPVSSTAPTKDDWVYNLLKPEIKKANADYLYIELGWSPNGCGGRIYWNGQTNSVPVARWWRIELWVSGTGYPFYTYNMLVPANTSGVFGTSSPAVFDCSTTLTGFQAFLL